jgi:hypothetical protein
MSHNSFTTNPVRLEEILRDCADGKIQLPDFQRSWVWAEDRILSLIASLSRAFPIGALMTLETRPGSGTMFARRPIQGALSSAANVEPVQLLLDGQQRMTSLFQACLRREVVETLTPKNKVVRRWFYIDINKALQAAADRDDAIYAIPEDRRVKEDFDRTIVLDLSSVEKEYQSLQFPLNRVFDWDEWQDGFGDYWIEKKQTEKRELFKRFKNEVLMNFKHYQVPVIKLGSQTTHEAVCLVFEKVNTGGKPLDAFELLTAMYAAKGHKLRDDWLGQNGTLGLQRRLAEYGHAAGHEAGVLSKVASTEVLQSIALLHTKAARNRLAAAGTKESDLPAIRATRQSLLDIPLESYLRFRDPVEAGYKRAVKFLRELQIHRALDLPYQAQIVALAAIFADFGDEIEHTAHRAKLVRWYWCGVFGELYGSSAESRYAKDIVEVPDWLRGGPEPSTVTAGVFRAGRLLSMRSRQSAAYKGIHALLMTEGARDFRTGQRFDTTVFFEELVDIHHVFPESWCKAQTISPKIYDSIINKTPLSYRTNRIIGGVAPSKYLTKLEQGSGKTDAPPIPQADLDSYLVSHCIPVDLLRADDFTGFMEKRSRALLDLIEKATGHAIATEVPSEDGDEPDAILSRDIESEVATT